MSTKLLAFFPLCRRAGGPAGRRHQQLRSALPMHGAGCCALAKHTQPRLTGRDPASPWEQGPSTPPPDRWELGTLQLGQRTQLAAHRGYFGQGSSHLPGQEAEELAHEQSPQEQPPALLCSPLEQIQALACPPQAPGCPASGPTFSLAARGQSFPPHRRRPRDNISFSPTTGPSQRAAQHHQPGKHPCHPGQEASTQLASHPSLAAAASICSPKASPPLPPALQPHAFIKVTFPGLYLPTVVCPSTQTTQALTWTLEFRPSRWPQVTWLSHTAVISPPAFQNCCKG